MPRKPADFLSDKRRQYFTGREKELCYFRSLLAGNVPDIFLLCLYGPCGLGKTTLLNTFMELCAEMNTRYLHLDGKNLPPTPHDVLRAIQMQLNTEEEVFDVLHRQEERLVIFIDTYELLHPLDDWFRLNFMPQMPEQVITVLSGRNPLSDNWMTDSKWQTLMYTLELRNLSPAESRAYLRKRKVSETDIEQVIGFAHGYPPALGMMADIYLQCPVDHSGCDNLTEPVNEQQNIPLPALGKDEFTSCVYESLKEYTSDKKLAQNPLIRSRLVKQSAGNETGTGILVAALRECLTGAADKIKEAPQQEKLYRVLFRTFFNPAGSQEQVALFLNIPFSTYRRYLKKAVALVTGYLWQLETER